MQTTTLDAGCPPPQPRYLFTQAFLPPPFFCRAQQPGHAGAGGEDGRGEDCRVGGGVGGEHSGERSGQATKKRKTEEDRKRKKAREKKKKDRVLFVALSGWNGPRKVVLLMCFYGVETVLIWCFL